MLSKVWVRKKKKLPLMFVIIKICAAKSKTGISMPNNNCYNWVEELENIN